MRIGFDLDGVLIRDIKGDFAPDEYEDLPCATIFHEMVNGGHAVYVVTGRLLENVPQKFKILGVTVIARDWDHPVDRLTAEDKRLKDRYIHRVAEAIEDDYYERYVAWKRKVVEKLDLDLYLDDSEDCCRRDNCNLPVAWQSLHVRTGAKPKEAPPQ